MVRCGANRLRGSVDETTSSVDQSRSVTPAVRAGVIFNAVCISTKLYQTV